MKRVASVALIATLAVPAALIQVPAQAGRSHGVLVEQQAWREAAQLAPSDAIARPSVDAIRTRKGTTYIGGVFDTVVDGIGAHRRRYVAALDSATGQLKELPLRANGPVTTLATRGDSLYLGGSFTRVNGVRRLGLAKVSGSTGVLDEGFKHNVDGTVRHLLVVDGQLFVGGSFERRLMSLDRHTGRRTDYLDVPVEGTLRAEAGPTSVNRFAVNPQHTRLVAVGNFVDVAGERRKRAFMVNLRAERAVLSSWYYGPLRQRCLTAFNPKVASLADVDFSPDGSYFVFAATGGSVRSYEDIGSHVCDAVARFETSELAPTAPTWINYTGGDTVWTVEATGSSVYAEGHFRWFDNPYGRDNAELGAVPRRGIAALDPTTGAVLEWNPDQPSTRGGRALEATGQGLWAGSDATKVNGEPRVGLAFFPLPAGLEGAGG